MKDKDLLTMAYLQLIADEVPKDWAWVKRFAALIDATDSEMETPLLADAKTFKDGKFCDPDCPHKHINESYDTVCLLMAEAPLDFEIGEGIEVGAGYLTICRSKD